MSNVISHAYEADEQGTIAIKLYRDEKYLHILFADKGKGMDDKLKVKIFQPFVTTARNKGGSGLGLNIVYNLVKQRFNGDIHVESEPGKGSRFHISLALEV
jgi:signal transduction histidine kinase